MIYNYIHIQARSHGGGGGACGGKAPKTCFTLGYFHIVFTRYSIIFIFYFIIYLYYIYLLECVYFSYRN